MLILVENPNSRKKPNNMGRKELVNWEKKPMVGIMDHRSRKIINGPQRK